MPDPYVHVPAGVFETLANGDPVVLEPADDHHVRRVLRLERRSRLVVSDGEGREATARLTADAVVLDGHVRRQAAPAPRLHLVQALAKSRKVDEVIRAVVELGVGAITVVTAERSVVQLTGSKLGKVQDRWAAIARSAAAQSRRAHLPQVAGPVGLGDVAPLVGATVGLVPHVGAERGLRTALGATSAEPPTDEVRIAIGPEGGWTDGEVGLLQNRGWSAVSLGSSVLRTEHAGLVAAAAAAAVTGWMD